MIKYLFFFLILLTSCNSDESRKKVLENNTFANWIQQQQQWLKNNSQQIKIQHKINFNNSVEEKITDVQILIKMLEDLAETAPDKFLASQPYRKTIKDSVIDNENVFVTNIYAENTNKAGIKNIKILHRKPAELFTEIIEIHVSTLDENLLYKQQQQFFASTENGKINTLELQNNQNVIFKKPTVLQHWFSVKMH